jgi:hypothetical protein
MIFVVSGLPRSGTSLLMQMLAAGGLPVLADGIRQPDTDNPRGYYEWERIKQLPRDPACIAEAEGKVVKVISALLTALPQDREYCVLLAQRPVAEVAASQAVMIARRGSTGASISLQAMAAALERHLSHVTAWLALQPNIRTCPVDYRAVISNPRAEAQRLADFTALPLDIDAMSRCVAPDLWRNRA